MKTTGCGSGPETRFGKYQLIRRLGRSMADVYLADDTEAGRCVVLKVIERSSKESVRLAIEAESRGARIQQQLRERDKRILEVYEEGEHDGRFFVALEYVPGRTLAEILETEHQIEAKRAARYAAEICDQLRTLHEFVAVGSSRKTAVVHGDIKPSNIQIGLDDELRLLDFGIAKLIAPGHDLTHHQLGSPSYCSPERLRTSQVDAHADLWALGVSLYEMLAGSPPFQAQSTLKLESLIQSRRPPRALPDSCPLELRRVVAKALSSDIDRRYASAEAFEKDLRAFLGGRPNQTLFEKVSFWKANATLVHQYGPKQDNGAKANERVPPPRSRGLIGITAALLAGVLAGLLLFVPIAYQLHLSEISRTIATPKDYVSLPPSELASDWQLYQTVQHRSWLWGQFFQTANLAARFHANLLASADKLIQRFRCGSEDQPGNLNWSAARLCLAHALEIDPLNKNARGELHLCDGYLDLQRDSGPSAVDASLQEFRRAEALLPRSPDPHLGLARAYVYGLHNLGAALGEFHQAGQLGYRLGPREAEEQADGYLFRATWELNRAKRTPLDARQESAKWLRLARADFERARSLYEPIASFSHVEATLQQLYNGENETARIEDALAAIPSGQPKAITPVGLRTGRKPVARRNSTRMLAQKPVHLPSHMVLLRLRIAQWVASLRWP